MAYIDWNENYQLGIPEIDEQHKRWVAMINEFYDRVSNSDPQENLRKLLSGAIDYARFHFGTEEAFMQRIGYAGLAAHREQHAAVAKRLSEFQEKADSGRVILSISVTGEMKAWLNDHILSEDRRYAEFYKSIGGRERV